MPLRHRTTTAEPPPLPPAPLAPPRRYRLSASRARALTTTLTAFIHHTRSASSLRAGIKASEVYIHTSSRRLWMAKIIFYIFIAVVARDKQKSAVQYDCSGHCSTVFSFVSTSGLEAGRPRKDDNPPPEIILLYY